MKCQDVMKKNIESVRPTDTIRTAARRMEACGIGFLPVCDESGKPVGAITDRDIAVRCVAHDLGYDTQVADAMTSDVVCCSPDDDLERASETMSAKQVSRVMCADKSGKLVGVITISDLARLGESNRVGELLEQVTQRWTQEAPLHA